MIYMICKKAHERYLIACPRLLVVQGGVVMVLQGGTDVEFHRTARADYAIWCNQVHSVCTVARVSAD